MSRALRNTSYISKSLPSKFSYQLLVRAFHTCFLSKNDFINDVTTFHKHYDLILTLQLYIKRNYSTLYPEKKKNQCVNYIRQQKYTNNNNRQGKKTGVGIDSVETTFDLFPFFVMEFYLIPHKCHSTFYISFPQFIYDLFHISLTIQ